ncbi:hypothetical protein EVA25_03830 [bacterium]|nr:MAG: hypothetical protein EVA25_03830 [bacterium]
MSSYSGRTVGPYHLLEELGRGGMGVVYKGVDPRLERDVAVKVLAVGMVNDDAAKQRFLQEARSASALDHGNICTIYDIGETPENELYLVMAFYRGETLEQRIRREPFTSEDAILTISQIGDGLEAAHAVGIIHRDIKPANIMLTQDGGVKILDFGLAKLLGVQGLTQTGMAMGTVSYMSPEQARGEQLDHRTDIWSLGVVLYEMLSGELPFVGDSLAAVIHALQTARPRELSQLQSAIDPSVQTTIYRALSRERTSRFETVSDFIRSLSVDSSDETMITRSAPEFRLANVTVPEVSRPPKQSAVIPTRVVALPFRMLRPDEETDFLAFSLPDAITSSLHGLGSLVVRSSAVVASLPDLPPDLGEVGRVADVDVVLHGTLLRVKQRLQVSAELVAVPEGSVLWTERIQVPVDDVFDVQDMLAKRILTGLEIPLTAQEQARVGADVPTTGVAYEEFLRGNQLADQQADWSLAQASYLRCLDQAPDYAPAWARLGRVYWLQGKYDRSKTQRYFERADEAFSRALSLNPDLAIAHQFLTKFEVDVGRAEDAMIRLLEVLTRGINDPQVFGGLVHACRYCGLLDESISAHRVAKSLDPAVSTSVAQTYFQRGDFDWVIAQAGKSSPFIFPMALMALGRVDDAKSFLDTVADRGVAKHMMWAKHIALSVAENRAEDTLALVQEFIQDGINLPEELFNFGRVLSYQKQLDEALPLIQKAILEGYVVATQLERDEWLIPLRDHGGYEELKAQAGQRQSRARDAFEQAGGSSFLRPAKVPIERAAHYGE